MPITLGKFTKVWIFPKKCISSSNGPLEVEDYLTDKQLQQQTIGLFGKEVSDEINEFLQQKTGITIQD